MSGDGDGVLDLGPVCGPVLVFGGPYGNLQATLAVLAQARDLAAERIICTGDAVAYCAEPEATVGALREAGVHVVMGNCEESLGFDKEDCGCGFAEGSECDLLSVRWMDYARSALSPDSKAWMRALPRRLRLRLGGRRLSVIHGGVADISRYVFASTAESEKASELDRLDADGALGGHSGLPFTCLVGSRLWHNPGAIGMPANDGTPRVWYSVLAETPDGVSISHLGLDYDHGAAARAMRTSALPEAYARTIEDGLWPNMDVMPSPERALRARPIRPWSVLWPAG